MTPFLRRVCLLPYRTKIDRIPENYSLVKKNENEPLKILDQHALDVKKYLANTWFAFCKKIQEFNFKLIKMKRKLYISQQLPSFFM